MDIEQLRAFVALARAGGFTRAAKQLGVSQPSLSRRVQQLEREVRARLVVRTPRGVVLTSAGERYLAHADQALAALSAGAIELEEIAGQPRGAVAIGVQPTVGAYALPPVLAQFHVRHPEVTIRLREGMPAEIEERLAGGELDLALLNLPVKRVELAAQKLWQEDYVLAVPLGHRLAGAARAIALVEAASEPFVIVPGVPATTAIEAACEERGVRPRVVVETDNLESARRMIEQGIGMALIPRMMTTGREAKRFAVVEVSRGGIKRQVALVHRGEGYLTAAARAMRATIVERLKRTKLSA